MQDMTAAEKVSKTIVDVLYTPEEIAGRSMPPDDAVIAEGITGSFAFHPGRLESAKPRIAELIRDIVPDNFLASGGGGWSFLQLCQDRNDQQWGEHHNMQELVCLAIAAGMARYSLPREFWGSLPGGVPYIVFDPPAKENQ